MLDAITHMSFGNPLAFIMLLMVPFLIWYLYRKHDRVSPRLQLPTTELAVKDPNWRIKSMRLSPIFKILAMICLIIVVARPTRLISEEEVNAEGIDIFLVMDLSSSMLARDFKPDRITASKRVASEFVQKRIYDRIGLSVFAGEAYTQSPLTTDHHILIDYLKQLQVGILQDGTAIGMGLSTAVNRLKDSKAESKVIILLTDGDNNAGYINPRTAANLAEEYGIKVYTIGVGSSGQALAPSSRRRDGTYTFAMSIVKIDEALLREIASKTGGRYFRAQTEESLEAIYAEIDKLEKTEMEISVYKRNVELYRPFLLFAFILILLDWVAHRSIWNHVTGS